MCHGHWDRNCRPPLREGVPCQKACIPYSSPLRYSRVAVPLHFTLKSKSGHSGIFWKGAKMELRRRGSVWKEQMNYFFLSWRMRSAPGHPSSMEPTPDAHAHLGGGRILKARPPRLRQCAQQLTPRNRWTLANRACSRPLTHHSRNHGGSGGSLS